MVKVSDAHLEARRHSIIAAACSIFSRKGVESATMAEIAAEAGLSPGAIYRYFENKDELARGCLDANALDLEEEWKHSPSSSSDAMADFARLSRLTFATLNDPEQRLHTMLMMENIMNCVRQGDEALAEQREGFATTRSAIAQRLQLAKERGELPAGLDPELVSGALLAFYLGSRICKLVDQALDTDGQLDQMVRLLEAINPQRRG